MCTRAIDSKVLSTITDICFAEIDGHFKNTLIIANNSINSHYITLEKELLHVIREHVFITLQVSQTKVLKEIVFERN